MHGAGVTWDMEVPLSSLSYMGIMETVRLTLRTDLPFLLEYHEPHSPDTLLLLSPDTPFPLQTQDFFINS